MLLVPRPFTSRLGSVVWRSLSGCFLLAVWPRWRQTVELCLLTTPQPTGTSPVWNCSFRKHLGEFTALISLPNITGSVCLPEDVCTKIIICIHTFQSHPVGWIGPSYYININWLCVSIFHLFLVSKFRKYFVFGSMCKELQVCETSCSAVRKKLKM